MNWNYNDPMKTQKQVQRDPTQTPDNTAAVGVWIVVLVGVAAVWEGVIGAFADPGGLCLKCVLVSAPGRLDQRVGSHAGPVGIGAGRSLDTSPGLGHVHCLPILLLG